jgi:ectoine hydroxylase-related dioxygenase (phytanoyl-CoA dioxygenase family)
MVALEQVTRADGLSAVMELLDRDGAVIVRDMVAPDVLEQFRADMQAEAARRVVGPNVDHPEIREFWGERTMRFTRLAHRSRAFIDILTDPYYLAVADAVLLPNCNDYWMNTGQMMILAPGEDAQYLHRDAANWKSMSRPDGFEVTISCMFAISDFTAELGATRVVPGSHRWEDYERAAQPHEICQAVMPAGGGMIYTGRVLHGAGANITPDQTRFGMHLSYVVGWLTPEEAGPLGTSWDEVRDLGPVAQRLLGWRCSNHGARIWTVDYDDVPTALGLT